MADLIKKIKIKKQDGTFTDYIPIGAEAKNISTEDGESVENKLNKKPYCYNSVADMKADTKLKAGDMAITLGYYEPNDGGKGTYQIIQDNTLIDDGGSIHNLTNGNKAKLVVDNDTVIVNQFGAKGNDSQDDTEFIQKALNFANEKHYRTKMLSKTYIISNLVIPSYCYLFGNGWKNTSLKTKKDTTGNMISITDEQNVWKCILKDFSVTGYRTTCLTENAIYIDINSGDAWCMLEDIRISYITGNAIKVMHGRELRFKNLDLTRCSGWGFYAGGGSDNQYFFITASFNNLGGIYANHAGTRWISCKCFANGENIDRNGNGFYVGAAQGQTFIGCEAQENLGHGWYLKGTKNSNFISIGSDTNGLSQKTEYVITDDSIPQNQKDYYTLNEDGTYHCETQYSWLTSFEDGVIYYEKPLIYAGMFMEGTIHDINVELTCNDFRRVEDIDPCQGYGIIFSENTAHCTFTLHIVNNPIYYQAPGNVLKTSGFNIISLNGSIISSISTNGIKIADDATVGYPLLVIGGAFNNNYNYRFYENPARDNALKLDINQGSGWKCTPLTISKEGDFSMGVPNGRIGFFGSFGAIKQTCENNATDLTSAIILINNIKSIMKSYGLISSND